MNKNKKSGLTPDHRSNSPKTHRVSSKNAGNAIRAQKRNQDDAANIISHYNSANQKTDKAYKITPIESGKLKVTFLGGLEDIGEKNMAVIEFENDALILDCGFNLSVDLPGINYEINDTSYLETIKHKIKGYVLTHGHMDHIGGLKHTVPHFSAPIYGSQYTIGVVGKTFSEENFKPQLIPINIDNHERLKLGCFSVEFIRVTHSIPDPTAICINTPVGNIIATGDFRLDPEPLDNKTTDIERLKQLGQDGVLLLLSESSYSDAEGRTPTEHTLQPSFDNIISHARGRIFVGVFSSNINRIQMIMNAAVANGRKVALVGRSMISYVNIAAEQGILKMPKGTLVDLKQMTNLRDSQVLIMCTGGQGEPNAALQRMSEGKHKTLTLSKGDTVVISSSPIPGNEVSYDQISNRLNNLGVQLFRHPTHEIDGCGPLHVSGHARREELREMIRFTQPKFFVPVHGGSLRRRYHADLAFAEGIPEANIALPNNGDSIYFTADTMKIGEAVPYGSVLVDQNGFAVNTIVIKDRLMLGQEGILTILLTIDSKTGNLLTSPDIISRGFIVMNDSYRLMDQLKSDLRVLVQKRFQNVDLERLRHEINDSVVQFLFEKTGKSPIVIPIVNIVGGTNSPKKSGVRKLKQGIREKLLVQDQMD